MMNSRCLRFSIRSLLVGMLLCAVAVHFWPRHHAGVPDPKWRKTLFQDSKPLTNIPEIKRESTDGSVIRVTAKNVGSTTLQYYSGRSGHIQLFQETNNSGHWTKSNWDWCGTGKELLDIAPNNSAELVVDFWDDQRQERMLAAFSEMGTNRSGLVILTTEPRN